MHTPTAPCPACFADRPYPLTVTEGTFLPGSDCPTCGQVAPNLEFEVLPSDASNESAFVLALDPDGVITRSAADGVITPAADGVISPAADGVISPAVGDDVLDTFRPDDADQAEDYARNARLLGIDPDLVFAALASRVA